MSLYFHPADSPIRASGRAVGVPGSFSGGAAPLPPPHSLLIYCHWPLSEFLRERGEDDGFPSNLGRLPLGAFIIITGVKCQTASIIFQRKSRDYIACPEHTEHTMCIPKGCQAAGIWLADGKGRPAERHSLAQGSSCSLPQYMHLARKGGGRPETWLLPASPSS